MATASSKNMRARNAKRRDGSHWVDKSKSGVFVLKTKVGDRIKIVGVFSSKERLMASVQRKHRMRTESTRRWNAAQSYSHHKVRLPRKIKIDK